MIKKLIKIALLTGAAHVFTIITLKYLSQHIDSENIGRIGEIDSLFQFIINLVALGMQLSAVRYIAINENLKPLYKDAQRARLTFSLFLVILSSLFFLKPIYILFLTAPFFALSGDYALYGLGKPVTGALLAFFWVFIPAITIIVLNVLFNGYVISGYIISTILIFLFTGLILAKWIDAPYFYTPSIKSLKLYIQSINLGIVILNSYIVGLGLIFIAPIFYDQRIIAIAYFGLKVYMIFKGVLRIINQAFIKEMLSDEICLKVDQIAGLAGLGFAFPLILFPKSFIILFFSDQYQQYYSFIVVVGISGFIAAIFVSLLTRSTLKHKDALYAKYSTIASLACLIIEILFSRFYQNPVSIAIALLTGELLLTFGLVWINRDIDIKSRINFYVKCLLTVLGPILTRIYLGDSKYGVIIAVAAFTISAIFCYWRFGYKTVNQIVNSHSIVS